MQTPDFSVGFGSEIEESSGSFVNVSWLVVFALVLAAVGYLVWRKKGKKR